MSYYTYAQSAQTAPTYVDPSQSASYMPAMPQNPVGTANPDPSNRQGNNRWGSAGTMKCNACRHRHKKCVVVPGAAACVFCDKHRQPCQLEFAPKQQRNLNESYRAAEMSSTASQECDVFLSDIVRMAERNYQSYGVYEILALVAESMGYTISPKSASSPQELEPTQGTVYSQPGASTTTMPYVPSNGYSMYPSQTDMSGQFLYAQQPTTVIYPYPSTSAPGGTGQC